MLLHYFLQADGRLVKLSLFSRVLDKPPLTSIYFTTFEKKRKVRSPLPRQSNFLVFGIYNVYQICTSLLTRIKVFAKMNIIFNRYIIEEGGSLEQEDNCGVSALHWACFHSNTDMIEELIDNDVDIHHEDILGILMKTIIVFLWFIHKLYNYYTWRTTVLRLALNIVIFFRCIWSPL